MHGFPDDLHIYDDLVPDLVAAGRRVVAFNFLGFGASDLKGMLVEDITHYYQAALAQAFDRAPPFRLAWDTAIAA